LIRESLYALGDRLDAEAIIAYAPLFDQPVESIENNWLRVDLRGAGSGAA
jgi:hypothetical protein